MYPSLFARHHVSVLATPISEGTIFNKSYFYLEFVRYTINRLSMPKPLRHLFFFVLCIQILIEGLQPWNMFVWSTDSQIGQVLNFLNIIAGHQMIHHQTGKINSEGIGLAIIYILDLLLMIVAYIYYRNKNRIPKGLLIIYGYLQVICSTMLFPAFCAFCGSGIKQSQSNLDVLFYIIAFLFVVFKTQITIAVAQNTFNISQQIYYTTYYTTSLYLLLAFGLFTFITNSISDSFIEYRIPSYLLAIVYLFFIIREFTRYCWLIEQESIFMKTCLTSGLLTTIIVTLSTFVDNISQRLIPVCFLVFFLLSLLFYIIYCRLQVKASLKRLQDPEYVQKSKSSHVVARDLYIGLRENAKPIIDFEHTTGIYQKYPNSYTVCAALSLQKMIFADFPIDAFLLKKSLTPSGFFLPLKDTFSLTLMDNFEKSTNNESYNDDVKHLQKSLWKLLGAANEFYKAILNEMTDTIPATTMPFHRSLDKYAAALLKFVKNYPQNQDGAYFIEILQRISPRNQLLDEILFWDNYRCNFYKDLTEIFPKLVFSWMKYPNLLESYALKPQPQALKNSENLIHDDSAFITKNIPTFVERGPFSSVLLAPSFIIIVGIFLIYLIIVMPILISNTWQDDTIDYIDVVNSIVRRSYQMTCYSFPFQIFYNNGNQQFAEFWTDDFTVKYVREYLMDAIQELQDSVTLALQYTSDSKYSDVNYILLQLDNEYRYFPLFNGKFSLTETLHYFMYLVFELIVNDHLFITIDPGNLTHTFDIVTQLTNISSVYVSFITDQLNTVNILSNWYMNYFLIGIGALHIIVLPLLLFSHLKGAAKRTSQFFTSLRDAQKPTVTNAKSFVQEQMRYMNRNKSIWKAERENEQFAFFIKFVPIILYISLTIIFCVLITTNMKDYQRKVDSLVKSYSIASKQYQLLTQIVETQFFIFFDESAVDGVSYDRNWTDIQLNLLEQFVIESSDSLEALDNTISSALKNWLDDQILQEWIAGSTILQDINNNQPEQLKQMRYYFQMVDPRAVVLIRQMQDDWKITVSRIKDTITVYIVIFVLIPVVALIYFIALLEYYDKPFMDTLSLLEILGEKVISADTLRIILHAKNKLKKDDLQVDSSFYDLIVQTLPDPVFVINSDISIVSYNKAAKSLLNTSKSVVGFPLLASLNIEFNVVDFNVSLDVMLNSYILDDRISSPTYNIFGMQRDRRRYFALTLLPLYDSEQTSNVLGYSHRAPTIALTFRDTTTEMFQQELIEQESSRFMQIINQILPKEIADRLLREEKTISMTVEKVCVSFCDIVSFTPWCASQTADSVVTALNTMFTLFDDRCMKYRSVTKIKTIGDCYMSAAGIFDKGDTLEESAHQMLSFALDLIESIQEVNQRLNTSLRVRVGVALGGPISAGVMGIKKPAFDVYGQVVNDAQNMESSGMPLMVHINNEMYQIVKDAHVNFEKREDDTYLVTRYV